MHSISDWSILYTIFFSNFTFICVCVFLCELKQGVRGQPDRYQFYPDMWDLARKLRCQVCHVLYPLSHLQPHWIHFSKIIVLPLSWSSQWFPMTYSKVNHCDTAFQSSSEFSSSPSDKSGHGHQHTSSTIWYLSSANYIYFTPVTSLCSLFSIFLNSIWSSLDLPMVAIPIFQSPHKHHLIWNPLTEV